MHRGHRWPVAAVICGTVAAGLVGVSTSGVRAEVFLDAPGFVLAAILGLAVLHYRPRRPVPWLLLGLGLLLSGIGDVLWDVAGVAGTPSWTTNAANLSYLASYPLYVCAAFGLLGTRALRRDAFVLLEAAVIALAAWLALWVLYVHPDLAHSGLSLWDWIPTVLYPPLDLLVIVAIWRLGRGDLRRSGPWLLLMAGFLVMLTADTLYAMLGMPDGTTMASALDLGWMLAYACLAAAAVHPAMRYLRAESGRDDVGAMRLRVAAVATAATVPFVLLLAAPTRSAEVGPLVAGTGLVVVLLAGLRFQLAATRNRQAAATLAYRAAHDPLTGLANRAALKDQLGLAALRAARADRCCAVLFVDLDDFKMVNDSLGHEEGDRLLRAVAERLRDATRAEECVARLGGDEFVVVLEDLGGATDAIETAERLLARLAVPMTIAETEVCVGASIGVALHVEHYADVETALRDADLAMYAAKARSRGTVCVFDPDMHARALDALAERNAIRLALSRGELSVEYQPIYDARDECQVGVEALARWHHDGRSVPPVEFIPLAEASGEIVAIGEWVLETAARELATADPGGSLLMSVNLSPRQLEEPEFASRALAIVGAAGIEPPRVVLELTESAILEPDPTVDTNLRDLGAAGFQLAIDDFGTGYSSLAYLKRLAVDWIKIDRMFVQDLGVAESDEALVRTLVRMGSELGIRVIAEGVETVTQLEMLRALGCDAVQGFLLARPGPTIVVPADAEATDRVA